VVNQGNLTTSTGGYVALLGNQVSNQGKIITPQGTTLLAAGDNISITLNNGSLMGYSVNQGTLNALAENKQLIQANGGTVILTAQAVDDIATATVNNTGVIEAKGLVNKNGTILLLADMETGTVNVGGRLDASAASSDANGGFIETSAAYVKVADDASVSTYASNGNMGTWLIDPTDFTIAASGGNISGAAVSSNLAAGNMVITNMGAGGGHIYVNDNVSWGSASVLTLNSLQNIYINAPITATGASAGLVLNYGGYLATGSTSAGTNYHVNAPVTLSGSASSLNINGQAYTLIRNMADFAGIVFNPLGFYAVANNLTASSSYSGAVLMNLGEVDSCSAACVFSGLGHTLVGLNINSPNNFTGLFSMNYGTIRDFGVLNSNVNAGLLTGGLVSTNYGTVSGSFFDGTVNSNNYNESAGLVSDNRGSIRDSYSSGFIVGGAFSGGLVASNSGSINNTYSTVSMSNLSPTYVGGLVGLNQSAGDVTNSRAYGSVIGYDTGFASNNLVLNSNSMKLASSFAGWDLATVGGSNSTWRIYDGNTAPLLRSFMTPTLVTVGGATVTYDGTDQSAANTSYSSSGFILPSLINTGNAGYRNAGSYTLGSNLYSIQQGYDLSYIGGNFLVNKAGLTLTATADTKTYNGNTSSSGVVSVTGLKTGDTLSGLSQVFDSKNVGSCTLTATAKCAQRWQ
jgi:hypothetical protein